MTRALASDRQIDVIWSDGSDVSLPHLWVRDNCPCSECRVDQTTEKRFHLPLMPVDLAPVAVSIENDVVAVTWPDGHLTEIPRAMVDAAVGGRTLPELRYWSGDFSPMRVDHDQFFGDTEAAIAAVEEFLATGVLVLTGCPVEPGSLENFDSRLGAIRQVPFDRIHDVEVDPSGYNVAHTSLPLPPHNDFASMSWPPTIQALHMLANECDGGASVVVDSWAILEEMRQDEPELFQALAQTTAPFRMFSETEETYTVGSMLQLSLDGSIERFRYSNQTMQPMDPTQPGVDAFYRAYHDVSVRIMDRANQARFRLESGHCLLVASHRVLHARDGFEPTGVRHLQDAYFEHDNVRNLLFLLRQQQAGAAG